MGIFGVPELIAVALLLGVPIWFALRSKPLGPHPYRWATWVAIQSLVIFGAIVPTAAEIMIARGPEFAPVYLCLVIGLGIGGAIGVLRRKRVGVKCLVASEALAFLMVPLLSMSPLANAVNNGVPSVPMLVVVIANCVYFRRRWTLLGPADEQPEALA